MHIPASWNQAEADFPAEPTRRDSKNRRERVTDSTASGPPEIAGQRPSANPTEPPLWHSVEGPRWTPNCRPDWRLGALLFGAHRDVVGSLAQRADD